MKDGQGIFSFFQYIMVLSSSFVVAFEYTQETH